MWGEKGESIVEPKDRAVALREVASLTNTMDVQHLLMLSEQGKQTYRDLSLQVCNLRTMMQTLKVIAIVKNCRTRLQAANY